MGLRELIEWIEKQKFDGKEPEELKHYLVDKGWNPSEVAKAVDAVWHGTQEELLPEIDWKKSSVWGLSLLIVLLVVALPFMAVQNSPSETSTGPMEAKGTGSCSSFPQDLYVCEPSMCEYKNPETGDYLQRNIINTGSDCQYTEEMPRGGKLVCFLSEDLRKAVAKYYLDVDSLKATSFDLSLQNSTRKYNVSGEMVENPLQKALSEGDCLVKGYSEESFDNVTS